MSLVAERPADDAIAMFELAGVRDFVGRETEAEPLYRRALGLDGPHRGQAVIQLAPHLPARTRAVTAYANDLLG